jgi:redox-sensitive bicupin YhaK (pirin superfamily)
METRKISNIQPIGFHWKVWDPFLFCAHHRDHYPAGNERLGPDVSLAGRDLGQDFVLRDGFRMYHGLTVPGFPEHPHRGFETITIVLSGFVDHSDSHGQAGRYGMGDVQWMTAGSGLQHSEMFPLLHTDRDNPAELFQVWLNLPAARKFAAPYFKMLWSEQIPVVEYFDAAGKKTTVRVIAGLLGDHRPPDPAPDSWAADPENHVAIWVITMEPGAEWELPSAHVSAHRHLYFYRGDSLRAEDASLASGHGFAVDSGTKLSLTAGKEEACFLLLQGKPIGEPVVQYGPFVMNTEQEIRQAFDDYRRTRFGGWPWPTPDHVFPRTRGRFARYAGGREETP